MTIKYNQSTFHFCPIKGRKKIVVGNDLNFLVNVIAKDYFRSAFDWTKIYGKEYAPLHFQYRFDSPTQYDISYISSLLAWFFSAESKRAEFLGYAEDRKIIKKTTFIALGINWRTFK